MQLLGAYLPSLFSFIVDLCFPFIFAAFVTTTGMDTHNQKMMDVAYSFYQLLAQGCWNHF